MNINIKLNPHHVGPTDFLGRYRSKASVMNTITNHGKYSKAVYGGNSFVLLLPRKDGEVIFRVYSIEKRRKKVEVLDKPVKWTKKELRSAGLPPDTEKWHKRKVITPTHWVGVYYDIPLRLLELANLRVVQGLRTFRIEKI